jgi:dihydroorotate dehydrogenase (NAD+) catalytic subunit
VVDLRGIDLSVNIGKLELKYPTFMGSGCYGSGEEFAAFVDLARIGAVVLKSVTRLPRLGNPTPRLVHTPAGMLNAIGLQNPGIDWYLEHEVANAYVGERLAARDEIDALEVNISCPNVASEGETFACDPNLTAKVVRSVRATTDKTLIVKLSPNVTDIASIAREAEAAGADALAVINTVRGMAIDVDRWQPRLGNVTGGLSGAAIRPIAVLAVYEVARDQRCVGVFPCGRKRDFDRYGKFHRSSDSRTNRRRTRAVSAVAQPWFAG